MAKCRVLCEFDFKKGMEDKGLKLIEKNLFDLFLKHGALSVELFQDAENHSKYYYAADWNSLNDARKIQKEWEQQITELRSLCTNNPKREFYELKSSRMEKMRKAA